MWFLSQNLPTYVYSILYSTLLYNRKLSFSSRANKGREPKILKDDGKARNLIIFEVMYIQLLKFNMLEFVICMFANVYLNFVYLTSALFDETFESVCGLGPILLPFISHLYCFGFASIYILMCF